jgi:hypothetical protein
MEDLARGLRAILGNRLIGVYLGGSASMGDFREASSDVDFLVVTDGHLAPSESDAIARLHDDLRRSTPYGDRLEGDYAPRELLIPEGTASPVPECRHGVFRPTADEVMLSADNIYNIRHDGVAFFGPDPRRVLPPVSHDHVRAAVRAMLRDGPGRCDTPVRAASEILDLLRSLCALERGVPVTKSDGATWGLVNLDARWHPTIRSALAVRQGRGTQADRERVCQDLPCLSQELATFRDAEAHGLG